MNRMSFIYLFFLISTQLYVQVSWMTAYVLEPRSQNIVPNIKAVKIVKKSLTPLYLVLRQYDLYCFHRQAVYCVMNDRGY